MDSDSQFGGTPPGTTFNGPITPMRPSIDKLIDTALDITAPANLEVRWDATRRVLYVDVDGITVLRSCQVGKFDITITNEPKEKSIEPGTPTGQG